MVGAGSFKGQKTEHAGETGYLLMCLQRGPNSPLEPLNLEERDDVSREAGEGRKKRKDRLKRGRERESGKEGWSKTRRKQRKTSAG